jgi:hypothetical protein
VNNEMENKTMCIECKHSIFITCDEPGCKKSIISKVQDFVKGKVIIEYKKCKEINFGNCENYEEYKCCSNPQLVNIQTSYGYYEYECLNCKDIITLYKGIPQQKYERFVKKYKIKQPPKHKEDTKIIEDIKPQPKQNILLRLWNKIKF